MHLPRLYAYANMFIFTYSPLTPSNEPKIKDPTCRSSKLKNKDHHFIHSLHHPDDYNLVTSALMSAGAPMRKGVYRLNCPEIPSHRRSADELPDLLPTNCQMNPTQDNHHPKKFYTTWNSTPAMENNTILRYRKIHIFTI